MEEATRLYKIKARKGAFDKWQEFTGTKKTTIEKMIIHCKDHLADMPYQLGIYGYRKIPLPRYKQTKQIIGQWFLIKILR